MNFLGGIDLLLSWGCFFSGSATQGILHPELDLHPYNLVLLVECPRTHNAMPNCHKSGCHLPSNEIAGMFGLGHRSEVADQCSVSAGGEDGLLAQARCGPKNVRSQTALDKMD